MDGGEKNSISFVSEASFDHVGINLQREYKFEELPILLIGAAHFQ